MTALAVTKLDGTAKGGVVLGIADQFNRVFDKKTFVDSLFD